MNGLSHAQSRRALMKEILRLASPVDRHAVSNVHGAAWRRNEDYLPRVKGNGTPWSAR